MCAKYNYLSPIDNAEPQWQPRATRTMLSFNRMKQTKLPVESGGNVSRCPRAAWKKMLFTLLAVALLAPSALAVNSSMYVGMATVGICLSIFTGACRHIFRRTRFPTCIAGNFSMSSRRRSWSSMFLSRFYRQLFQYWSVSIPGIKFVTPTCKFVPARMLSSSMSMEPCFKNTSPNWNAGYAVPNGGVEFHF